MWDDKRSLVLTFYGHSQVIDKIVINSLVSKTSDFPNDKVAEAYCRNINALELKEDSWIHAKVVPENTPLYLKTFIPFAFSSIILELDDLAVQRVLRDVWGTELAEALQGVGDDVLEKIKKNMSSRSVQMLKEDMECSGTLRPCDVKRRQDRIMDTIRYLEAIGEITVSHSKGDAHE